MIERVMRITDCGVQTKPALELRMAAEAECLRGECNVDVPAVVITAVSSGETTIVSIEDLYNALEQLAK